MFLWTIRSESGLGQVESNRKIIRTECYVALRDDLSDRFLRQRTSEQKLF